MTADYQVQSVVVGSGVVGLAIARKLCRAGHEVLLLEAEDSGFHHTSARNSQVIHAGMYYEPGSLKARLCVEGNTRLYDYCRTRHVDHAGIGKLIVATADSQLADLQKLLERGHQNGVADLRLISAATAKTWEPEIDCKAALYSPATGIVDAAALMQALLGEVESLGGVVVYHAPLQAVTITNDGFELEVSDSDKTRLGCRNLINAAGLGAWDIARRTEGYPAMLIPPQSFARGCYYSLTGSQVPFQRLIYPLPESGSLGVHYIRDTEARVTFGPDLNYLDTAQIDYRNPATNQAEFEQAIRRFWPGLPDDVLQPDSCGIRPRITLPGQALADFMIVGEAGHHIKGLVQLLGIESPGLTSALAIADYSVSLL